MAALNHQDETPWAGPGRARPSLKALKGRGRLGSANAAAAEAAAAVAARPISGPASGPGRA